MKIAVYGTGNLSEALKDLGLKPKEILVPLENLTAFEEFAQESQVKLKPFKIEWDVLEGPNVEVATNKRGGQYNKWAARNRDNQVLDEATHLLMLGTDDNLKWIDKAASWKIKNGSDITVLRWTGYKAAESTDDDNVPF